MSIKQRLRALERPQQKGGFDMEAFNRGKERNAAVARGEIPPISVQELTDLWIKLFNRPPNKVALALTAESYAAWMKKFRPHEVQA